MNKRALALLSGTFLALIAGVAVPASAHSFPELEIPPAGATLSEPPAQITIKYDAPIEKLFASLEVLNSAGRTRPRVSRKSAQTGGSCQSR